jgi:hypothetical protein
MASLNAQQIAELLQRKGVSPEKIPTMTAIALAESSGRTQAFNPTGLDKSYGLFQVNMYGGLGPARMKQFGLKEEKDLFNPEVNVAAAKKILDSQGLGAWSVYKSGKYKQFLPESQKATQALGQAKPDQVALQSPQALPGQKGNTFIIFGGEEEDSKDAPSFLNNYIRNLVDDRSANLPATSFDPSSSISAGILNTLSQVPKYV